MKHIPLKMVKRLSIIFSILGLLFILIGCCIGSMSTMAGLIVLGGLLILIGTIIFIALFCRCPHCGNYIVM